jgi:hypothetical protein
MIKSIIRYGGGVAAAALLATTVASAQTAAPGSVDFGTFTPPASGGEFVEVNVSSNIIAMVTKLGGQSEPELAEIAKGLRHIHVNVIGLDDSNRASVEERFKTIRAELDKQGWEKVVTVQGKDQDVSVQVKTHGSDTVEGIAVTVMDGRHQAVFVNIVGDIKPEKLSVIGERFNIEPLKKIGLPPKKSS